jgi:hypothetical protein
MGVDAYPRIATSRFHGASGYVADTMTRFRRDECRELGGFRVP